MLNSAWFGFTVRCFWSRSYPVHCWLGSWFGCRCDLDCWSRPPLWRKSIQNGNQQELSFRAPGQSCGHCLALLCRYSCCCGHNVMLSEGAASEAGCGIVGYRGRFTGAGIASVRDGRTVSSPGPRGRLKCTSDTPGTPHPPVQLPQRTSYNPWISSWILTMKWSSSIKR